MAKASTILDELGNSSLLIASLHGVRSIFERELGISGIQIETDDMIKVRIAQRAAQAELPVYPYAYLNITEMQAVKELQANKTVRRHGVLMGTVGATRNTSLKGYVFPARLQIDLKYVHSDPLQVIRVAEGMMILGQVGQMFFELQVGGENGMKLEPRLEIPESVAIPLADTTLPSTPGGLEVTLSFILHTYSGFFRDVAAVNNDRPTIDTTIVSTPSALGAIFNGN